MTKTQHGLKRLALDSWLDADIVYDGFLDGGMRPMRGEDWAALFLGTELDSAAPSEVHRLFNVARGCLLYGYFYHPLYAMGMEQMFRVAEAAAKHKCGELGRTKERDTFNNMIGFLKSSGCISEESVERWHAIREFRNITSHPDDQMIVPPGAVSSLFASVTEQVNTLFRGLPKT